MAKFNLYKLQKEKENDLIQKFNDSGLIKTYEKKHNGFTLYFYFSDTPDEINIWWMDFYSEYLKDKDVKNKVYFAAFIISNDNLLYAISLGKSHFYLKPYCHSDFGVNLAERIIDSTQLKLKNSKLFGGKRNKAITSYIANSEIEYDSGESIYFIKASIINKEIWGKTASFGNSVLLNIDISPDDITNLISRIEDTLLEAPQIIFPRATIIKDEEEIKRLDRKLIDAINSNETSIQTEESILSGVDFIFLDKSQFRFIMNGKRYSVEDLTIDSLKTFLNENKIILDEENINKIKVKVTDDANKGYTESLKNFIDFVDDERHCLIYGKWHVFNQNYLKYLRDEIDTKITLEHSELEFNEDAYTIWLKQQKVSNNKLKYPEMYFNTLCESNGYINLDRVCEQFENRYKHEMLDLYKDETAFFVKIGTPQKVGYVVDQAITSIKILQNLKNGLIINGEPTPLKKICLWIMLERKSNIKQISQINSLILLIKLIEWKKQCSNANFEAVVKIGYRK